MELDPVIVAIAGAAIAAGLCVLALATSIGTKDEKAYANRLARVTGGTIKAKNSEGGTTTIRSGNNNDSGIKFLDMLVKKYVPRPALLRKRLECTGLRISAGEYVLFSFVVTLFFGFISAQFLGRSLLVAS